MEVFRTDHAERWRGHGGCGRVWGTGCARLFVGLRYFDHSDDRDGDGIADADDACPDEAEDIDQYLDSEGCPDPDNDEDGILDVDDKCPNDAEDVDGYEDQEGCPDPDNDQDGILDAEDKCPLKPGKSEVQVASRWIPMAMGCWMLPMNA